MVSPNLTSSVGGSTLLIAKSLILFGSDEGRLREAQLAVEEEYGTSPLLVYLYLREDKMLSHLERQQTHVVLIDALAENVDAMPELVLKVRMRSPRSLVLLQSKSPITETVARCMKAGAFDFFDHSMKRKDMARATRRALKFASIETDRNLLSEKWIFAAFERLENSYSSIGSDDLPNHAKGLLLEELSVALFSSVEGWSDIEQRSRPSESEEIDLVIFNDSPDPFWRNRGDVILVECKNVEKGADSGDFGKFYFKVANRGSNCRLGFLIARSIRGSYQEVMRKVRGSDSAVVPLDYAQSLQALVHAVDRGSVFKRFVKETTLGKATWKIRPKEPSS